MPLSKEQDVLPIGGKQVVWNRLKTTASVQLLSELAPVILPAVMEVGINLPLAVIDGKMQMTNFMARELTGLPDAVRKALKELPFQRQMTIAKLALENTSIMGMKGTVMENLDATGFTAIQFYELLWRALAFQYGDFSDVLEGFGLRLRGQAPTSTESSTSAGPSSAS